MAGGWVTYPFDLRRAVCNAAEHGHLDCLDYVIEASPNILSCVDYRREALLSALEGGSLACIERLEQAGCTWELLGLPGFEAAYKRDPAPLRRVHTLFDRWPATFHWEDAMSQAIDKDDTHLMSLLYECGYEQNRPHYFGQHPAFVALCKGSGECFKLAVKRSGWGPSCDHHAGITEAALKGGKDMLRSVLGLGFTMHPLTAVVCARRGDVGALVGVFDAWPAAASLPSQGAMCEAAVMGNSLECLRFARQFGFLRGAISKQTLSSYYNLHPRDYGLDMTFLE